MPRYFQRVDKNIVRDIIKYRDWMRPVCATEDELMFCVCMKFDATRREQVWAKNWAWMGQKPTREIWKYYMDIDREETRKFNEDKENLHPTEEIGGVATPIQTVQGKFGLLSILKILHGDAAEKMAQWSELIAGKWKEKANRLHARARDKNLRRKHQAKHRALEKQREQLQGKGGGKSPQKTNKDEGAE